MTDEHSHEEYGIWRDGPLFFLSPHSGEPQTNHFLIWRFGTSELARPRVVERMETTNLYGSVFRALEP